jgi:hypothetical protein
MPNQKFRRLGPSAVIAHDCLRAPLLPRRVFAIENLGVLFGSCQAQLMRADDGRIYVVKLATNPFGPRVLVNEMVAAKLAWSAGLETPAPALVIVGSGLGAPPGVHFGSEFVASWGSQLRLPAAAWDWVANSADLIGAYVFDAWTGNMDMRQVVFRRLRGPKSYRLLLIDNGGCFGGVAWSFHERGVPLPAQHRFAYVGVRAWGDLEPWLSVVERMPAGVIEGATACVPAEWLSGGDGRALGSMAARLLERGLRIRAIMARIVAGGDHPFLRFRVGPEPRGAARGSFGAAA